MYCIINTSGHATLQYNYTILNTAMAFKLAYGSFIFQFILSVRMLRIDLHTWTTNL